MATTIVAYPVPTPNTLIDRDETVYIDAYSATGVFARVVVTVVFRGMAIQEVAYDGEDFTEFYAQGSTVQSVVDGTYGTGLRFALKRRPVWPDSPEVVVYDIDSAGTVAAVTPYGWLIAAPAAVSPVPVVPVFPLGAGPGPGASDATAHDADYFLGMLDRVLDEGYLAPLKETPGGGYEVLQGQAAIGARVSSAVGRLEAGNVIIYAEGGALATGIVEFYRVDAGYGAVAIKAGSTVETSVGGRQFITLDDAVFEAADLGPVAVRVQAVAQGWEWNVPGERVTAAGEVLPGEIDTCTALIQATVVAGAAVGPATFIDPTIAVQQIADCGGGAAPMLDGLGEDRGLPRQPGERDTAYRFRIRQLPDTVSPDAIVRAVEGVLLPRDLTHEFVETWDPAYQTCYDAPPNEIAANPDYDPTCFVYDDPRDATPFRNRWLDAAEARGAFVVVVPDMVAIRDVGMAYDDTAATAADLNTTLGARAATAYDVPPVFEAALQGGYDGFDLPKQAVYSSLWQTLQQIKAGGVAAIVEREGE